MSTQTEDWAIAADSVGRPAVLLDDSEFAAPKPKARALTQAEREIEKQNAARAVEESRRRLEAESKRFQEFDPLRKGAYWAALSLGIVIFLTSGLFSYAAIAAAAKWMQPEWAWLAYVVPGFIEAFLVFFGLDAVIYQAKAVYAKTSAQRAYYRKQARSALVWMFVFAIVAVVGNGAHTLARWLEQDTVPWFGWVGVVMSAVAPLSVVLITKRVSRLVFVYAVDE